MLIWNSQLNSGIRKKTPKKMKFALPLSSARHRSVLVPFLYVFDTTWLGIKPITSCTEGGQSTFELSVW